jgi:catechol 2,3-dioxygenase-like lactoylglutathione lyase family enzyme
MHLDHVAFRVSDMDRSIEFYTTVLGLKLLFKQVDENHHEAFAFLELEGGNLELLQSLDVENQPQAYVLPPIEPPYTPHVALKAENLDALVVHLKEQRVNLIKGPMEIPGQVKWLYLVDPDHNVLEFVEWITH